MKIEELNIDELPKLIEDDIDKCRYFYSRVYDNRFFTQGEIIFKLEPIEKQDCEKYIPFIEKRLNEISKQSSFPTSLDEKDNAFFGYRIPSGKFYNHAINICVRTNSSDKLIDDFLETHLDTGLIRGGCQYCSLDEKFNSKIRKNKNE